MSVLAAVLLVLSGLGVGAWFWRSAPRDLEAEERRSEGHQGRCVSWMLRSDLGAPSGPTRHAHSTPSDRVLAALLLRHGSGDADARTVHERLKDAHPDGVAGAFLRGDTSAAIRAAARNRFQGPSGLFWLWYWFVYRIRRGPRGIRLEVLCQAIEETRP